MKDQSVEIKTAKQAIKLTSIGERISEDIEEFITTNQTKRLNNLKEQYKEIVEERRPSIEQFKRVKGIGEATANKLYDLVVHKQKYRTLEDLIGARLTATQKVGLKWVNELKKSIPREEMDVINKDIQDRLEPTKCVGILVGSYRRGSKESGDIDLIIIGCEMEEVLEYLGDMIADTLYGDKPNIKKKRRKYFGVTTSGHQIDISIFTIEEYPTALLHATGSGTFNQLMRLRAKELEFKLNEYGLFYRDGSRVEVRDEYEIFVVLGVKYLEPQERTKNLTNLTILE